MTNVEKHKQICEYLNNLYERKNRDYGDSFHQSYLEEGLAMSRIRLGDKFSRFKTLSKIDKASVKDESIRDTLLDLANYAIMTVMELDYKEAIDHDEPYRITQNVLTAGQILGDIRPAPSNTLDYFNYRCCCDN